MKCVVIEKNGHNIHTDTDFIHNVPPKIIFCQLRGCRGPLRKDFSKNKRAKWGVFPIQRVRSSGQLLILYHIIMKIINVL